MKVSYCFTQNVTASSNRIRRSWSIHLWKLPCNCRKKREFPFNGKCRAYKSIASVDVYPNNVYLGTEEGDFKQRFYNHRLSLNSESHSTDTTLPKFIWGTKKKFKIRPSLRWSMIKSVPAYLNISKKCQLCLQEKFEILNYPKLNELFDKRSQLISKCRRVKKFLLSNYISND